MRSAAKSPSYTLVSHNNAHFFFSPNLHISIPFSHCLSLHIHSRVPITNQSGSLPAFCLNAELNLSHGMCTTTSSGVSKVKTHSHKCVYNAGLRMHQKNHRKQTWPMSAQSVNRSQLASY
eukprot:scpid102742/ scgid0231/ 